MKNDFFLVLLSLIYIILVVFITSQGGFHSYNCKAQLAGAIEYTNCISAER